MFLIQVLLLVIGFVAAWVCFQRGHAGAGWGLLAVGAVATVAVVAGAVSGAVPLLGNLASLAFALVAVLIVTARVPASGGQPEEGRARAGRARRTLLGAVLGVVPGVLIVGVTMLLYELDVITSDQSQFSFIGVPLAVVGLLVGALLGATHSPRRPPQDRPVDRPHTTSGP